MPSKHNAARRDGIPKARYRVRSWPAYEPAMATVEPVLPASQGFSAAELRAEAAIARWRKVVGVSQAAETREQEAAAS